ncbi:Ion transport family protein [Babesia bovis T2Bo]|uniref:Ion transport domain-containing protein n=1 Tax=Babesia bovis TaxID=5865 RepID=A7ANJ9_BABBO|nr:Ion transport family protein [Babesia bovis T2Bo]EDO08133.1 Ion transport family protein [Babesia bovis T2Bo]|eukprot:XP_001611701.1 hypothetical protein [Babesia bovis T2Bo]
MDRNPGGVNGSGRDFMTNKNDESSTVYGRAMDSIVPSSYSGPDHKGFGGSVSGASNSALTPLHKLIAGIDKRVNGNHHGSSFETDASADTSMIPLKYCGSSMLDASRFREEFRIIMRNKSGLGFRLRENFYYRIVYLFMIALYGILLGWSTSLDWSRLSGQWISTILILRWLFVFVFVFDAVIQGSRFTNWKLYTEPEFMVDVCLLICEVGTLVFQTIMISRHCVKPEDPGEFCRIYMHSLKLWSCLPLLRFYKLCKCNAELHYLSKGIILSIISLFWTTLFVCMVLYASAIYATWRFTDVVDETMSEHWGTLGRSMYTLFTILTLEGWNEISSETANHYPNCKLFFVLFVSFGTLTVMNVVTGIILNTFLSSNEKLSGEAVSKDRCDRYMRMCQAFRKVLGKPEAADEPRNESYHPPDDCESCKLRAISEEDGTKPGNNIVSAITHVGNDFVCRVRNAFAGHKESSNTGSDLEHGTPHTEGVKPASEEAVADQAMPPEPEVDVAVNRQTSPLLRSLMDEEDLNKIQEPPISNIYKQFADLTPMPNAPVPGDMQGRNTKRTTMLFKGEGVYDTIIDMTVYEPCEILSDRRIKRILRVADVPMYQAYEVLKLYYDHGLRRVTVTEFAVACERMNGTATGKDLLSFEVGFASRIANLESRIAQLNDKLDAVLQRCFTGHGPSSQI